MVICEQFIKGKCIDGCDFCEHASKHDKYEYSDEPCTKYEECDDLGIKVRCIYVKEK